MLCAYRPVPITRRSHLFPFRTQKLSSVVPKILGWRRPGKIGRCRLSLCHFQGPLPDGRGPFSLRPGRGPLFTAKSCARRRSARDDAGHRDGDGWFLRRGDKDQDQAALLTEKCKDRLLQVMQRKRAFPRPAQRCGGVMTVVADSLHSGKGQDQATFLAEKRRARLLQVLAKKKSVPQAGAA